MKKTSWIFVLVLLIMGLFVNAHTPVNETETDVNLDLLERVNSITEGGLINKSITKFDDMDTIDYVIMVIAVLLTLLIVFHLLKSGLKATLLAILLVILWQIATKLMEMF